MEFDAAQKLSLQQGLPIDLTIDEIPCVVIRKDLFDSVRSGEFDSSDVYELLEQTLGEDPGLAEYQQYKANP